MRKKQAITQKVQNFCKPIEQGWSPRVFDLSQPIPYYFVSGVFCRINFTNTSFRINAEFFQPEKRENDVYNENRGPKH